MNMKLCKECRWWVAAHQCLEPDNVDLVTGELISMDAYDMRNDKIGGRCGREARLFKDPVSHLILYLTEN